ncbi:MAG: hypothetical protein KGJ84_13480, partial [Elusimicrobia bacterium]|nr:hypothetical protein [Elusimicrobiota bacterium]
MPSLSLLAPLVFCLPAFSQTAAVSGTPRQIAAQNALMPCGRLPRAWVENHPQFAFPNASDDAEDCGRGTPN